MAQDPGAIQHAFTNLPINVLVGSGASRNLYTSNEAAGTVDATAFAGSLGATIARDINVVPVPGSDISSIRAAATAIGTTIAVTFPRKTSGITPGTPVRASATVLSDTVARTCTPIFDWYDNTGAYLSSSVGTGAVTSTVSWLRIVLVATPPALATQIQARFQFAAPGTVGELHYVARGYLGLDT